MKNKYVFVSVMLVALMLAGMGLTEAYVNFEGDEKEVTQDITVVTSFYPMYIATMNVTDGMDHIVLENLSEPQTGCLHDYQLTPADMKLLSTADVFVVNGGGIESFLTDIAEQYPELTIINACENVEFLEDNAHAWMNVEDYEIQVQTIAEGLEEKDSDHKEQYESNAQSYEKELDKLINQIGEITPYTQDQNCIIFHEAYEYLAEEYGMNVTYVMDLDEERQVSAGEVAEVTREIQNNGISTVFAEELYGKSMGDTVEKETDVNVYYLDTLVRGEYQKDSYLKAMENNIQIMKEAFVQ